MESWLSRSGNRFRRITETATHKAMARARKAAGSKPWPPGRTMISTPTKPTTVAAQRAGPTVSRNKNAARIVTKSGMVNDIAVTSASGITVNE